MSPYDDALAGTEDPLDKIQGLLDLWANAGSGEVDEKVTKEAPTVSDAPAPVRLREEQPEEAPPAPKAPPPVPPPEIPPDVRPMTGAVGATRPTSGAPGEPDWEKLQRDLQAAEGRAGTSRLINQVYATVSPNQHFHADMNAGASDIAAARAPLEMAQARQSFERNQQALDASTAAATANAAKAGLATQEMDPNSPVSQRARSAVRSFFGKTNLLPPDFDTFSAREVDAFIKNPLTQLSQQQSNERVAATKLEPIKAEAARKTEAAATAAEGEKTSLAAEALLLASDPRVKAMGWTPEKLAQLDRKGIEGVRREVETYKAP
jgi:hypothetical protein